MRMLLLLLTLVAASLTGCGSLNDITKNAPRPSARIVAAS